MRLDVNIDLSPAQLARAFSELDDEKQAQFFIELAAIAAEWAAGSFAQWRNVGRHLRDCACSTAGARDIVRDIAHGLGEQP